MPNTRVSRRTQLKLLRLLAALNRRGDRPTTVSVIWREAHRSWRNLPTMDTVRVALAELHELGVVGRRIETPEQAWQRAQAYRRRGDKAVARPMFRWHVRAL